MSIAVLQDLVSRVDVEARKLAARRVALTLISLPFILLGLVVGVVFKVVWTALSWAYAAVKVGFELAGELLARAKAGGG